MKSLLATGLNGLVGSKFKADYSDTYDITNLDISDPDQPVDITQEEQVYKVISNSDAETVLHLAAYTDVTKAHEQNGDKNGLAYQVNVIGTQNIVSACQKTGKHLVHISTAYIFDGTKETLYTEDDALNPIEWYGETKAEAEKLVTNSSIDWTILRIDQPFRSDPFPKPDAIRKLIASAQKGIPLFSDHYFGPTFIDDFSKVLDWIIATKTTGLFNATAGEQWSDYQLAQKIVEIHNLDVTVAEGSLTQYLKTTARPYQKNTALDSSKLHTLLPFALCSVEDAVARVQL